MQSDSMSPTGDCEFQSTRALMKTSTFVSFVAASLFTLKIHASISAEPAFERPQVALAADTAALLGRVEHALLQYAKNCETGDQAAISQALTDTAVIEYLTAQPERVVSVDASAAKNCWEGATLLKHATSLHAWIFPTGHTNTVFVQYETADGAVSAKESAEHLAMIEMDGLRIARIRDLTTYAQALTF
jgi:hypothetical protein